MLPISVKTHLLAQFPFLWKGLVFFWILIFPINTYSQALQNPTVSTSKLGNPPYLIPFPPGYPEVPKEGADSIEVLRYQIEKDKWIKENPELYFKISERPSIYTLSEQDSIRARKEVEMRVLDSLPRKR